MLAQLFLTPSGIMLDATLDAVVDGVSIAAELQASLAGCSSSVGAAPHAFDSTVGTEGSVFSLREPLVCAVDAPRPLPPLPRSAPRLRPRPPSAPARPARETFPSLVESPNVVTVASLALDRDLSFFAFETSPHCVIDPVVGCQHATSKYTRSRGSLAGSPGLTDSTYHQLCDQRSSPSHHSSLARQIQCLRLSSQGTSP
jgi:hypothetical protein